MTKQFNYLLTVLEKYATEFERIYKEKLKSNGHQATGELINSIKTKVRQEGDDLLDDYNFIIEFDAAEYWKWIEEGRKGKNQKPENKWPPREAILNWIRVKRILPRPDANGKLPTEEQLSYLIQRAIGENGTIKDKNYDGGHYVAETIEELNNIYRPKMEAALQLDLKNVVIETIETFGGAFSKLRKLI